MLSIAALHPGGAERMVATLCRHIDPDRFKVTVCWRQSDGEIGAELRAHGHDVVGLPELEPGISPYLRFRALGRLLRQRRIDVIHTHDTGSLADAAQCKMAGMPVKLVHSFHFGNYPQIKLAYLLMERLFARLADRLVAVGHRQAQRIRSALWLPADRLTVVYNGVETPVPDRSYGYRVALGLADKTLVIGSISTLTLQKGLPLLLEASALLQRRQDDFAVVIAGGGPLLEPLQAQARSLGLEGVVHFLDWVPRAADSLLHDIDIFCQSSLWEANSLVLLEAMGAGLPIVTTDVGESGNVVDHGVNGIVVPANDAVALADGLALLLGDPARRQRYAVDVRDKFDRLYSADRMSAQYQAIYAKLVDG